MGILLSPDDIRELNAAEQALLDCIVFFAIVQASTSVLLKRAYESKISINCAMQFMQKNHFVKEGMQP